MITNQTRPPVVHVEDVTRLFRTNSHSTVGVKGITFDAFCGELVLFLGPSGSGKTTLLTLIAGLIQPTSGKISLFGRGIDSYSAKELQYLRAQRIGFVFQTFHLVDSLTVAENVALVLRFAGGSRSRARVRTVALLDQFHIAHLAKQFPPKLSQGEKQRVAVARAIANEADLIIADEPTASLETKQGFEIIQLLITYAKSRQRCVIVASHDLRVVEFADRVMKLEDGVLDGQAYTGSSLKSPRNCVCSVVADLAQDTE